jgi:hypothetical protein
MLTITKCLFWPSTLHQTWENNIGNDYVYNSHISTCTWRFICMLEIWAKISKKVTNMDTWRQADVAGSLGTTWAHRPAPLGHRMAPHVPPWHCPHHRSMGASPQALPCVDLSWFASMVMMEWSWIHGSTVKDLEPSNQPPNHITSQIFTRAAFTTTFGSQPRPMIERRWNQGPASALPTPPGAPTSLHRLSFRHMQGNTLRSNVVRPFMVVSLVVWSKGKERVSRGSLTWWWSSPYSTLGYK